MLRFLKSVAPLVVAVLALAPLKVHAAAFTGAAITFDATVQATGQSDLGTAAVNDGKQTAAPPASGATFSFEVFVGGSAGKSTIGFDLKFDNTGNQFSDNFTMTATSFAGPMSINATQSTASALIFPVAQNFPANNAACIVTLTAKRNVPEGTVVKLLATSSVADGATLTQDVPNVAGAIITFQTPAGPALAASPALATIPRGGSVNSTVTLSNITNGASINWTVTKTGTASVSVQGQTGLTFTTTSTGTTASITLVASGAGSATATVGASVGGTAVTAVNIVFSETIPAELSAFGAEVLDRAVAVNWTTASQTNNAGWRVMRSTDGVNFVAVSELIPGAGTSDALLPYSFRDEGLPQAEIVYYRLDQIDLDGTIRPSNAIEVILGARFMDLPTEFATSVYPNPFNPSTTVAYDLPSEANVSIVIYDALGQEVRRLVTEPKAAGRYTVQWDARDNLGRNVGSGVYIAKVEAGSFSTSQKMLLLK